MAPSRAYLFSRMRYIFSRVGVSLSLSEPSWVGYQRRPKATFLKSNSMASRHLKTTMFNFSEEFWVATISKTSTFEVDKFSQNFSPLRFRWVLPAGLGPWPRLPRPHTAAFGSLRRPRLSGWAAPRGQGTGGCEDERWPWPRTKDLGRENLLSQWDLYVRKWMKCWRFKLF